MQFNNEQSIDQSKKVSDSDPDTQIFFPITITIVKIKIIGQNQFFFKNPFFGDVTLFFLAFLTRNLDPDPFFRS